MARSKERDGYRCMMDRCYKKTHPKYPRYGGRGIAVCFEWRHGDGEYTGFDVFLYEMGKRPKGDYCLDRIDNNKGYSAKNCRWATRLQSMRNTRRNYIWTIKGRDFQSAKQAGDFYGVSEMTIRRWCLGRGNTPKKKDCFVEKRYA